MMPPILSRLSNKVTLYPRDAKIMEIVMPAGPAPMTAAFMPLSAFLGIWTRSNAESEI